MSKLGCVVRMVVDFTLPHAESGPNDHRKDALPFISLFRNLTRIKILIKANLILNIFVRKIRFGSKKLILLMNVRVMNHVYSKLHDS